MRTLARLALVPAVAAALLTACGSSGEASPATTSAAATTAPAATVAPSSTEATATTGATVTTAIEQPSAGDIAQIDVKVGVNDSKTRVENVALNQRVVITLQSDSDEEYHLHGYELEKKVAAGNEWTFDFTATKAGFFPLESHTTNSVLLILHVT